jgi:hypothetical protein
MVEVGGEDLPLGPAVCELVREARLVHLALQRALAASDVEVAHELLRDRGSALDDAAGLEIGDDRAADREDVDAAVLVEAAVLDRNRAFDEPRRDLLQEQRLAVRRRRHAPRSVPSPA